MRKTLTLAATVAAFFALASLAPAAEITRDEYKTAVEPTCKKNTKSIQKTLKGVEAAVRKGELRAQAPKLARAGKQMKKTYNQLKVVPQPTADEARLGKWLSYIKQEANLFTQLSTKAKKNQKGAFSSVRSKMDKVANKANVEVLPFNFRDCRVEPSKFT